MKKALCYICVLAICLSQTACGKKAETVEKITETTGAPVQIESMNYSEKDWQTDYTDPVELTLADGTDVQITEGGTYLLTGSLTEGQILVDAADEDVRLVLAGVHVQNTGSAALYIREAKNVYVTLKAEAENTLSSTGEFVQTDTNNVDAAVFSKSDLIINGTGDLTVYCETGHGIVSKDDLTITGGTFAVTAAGQCIVGKDSTA
ncbi:MAG: carbohydrate-binding domain-containing protein, partial [Clostridia bacterium]|nr:carbohydrate-binding domain-containing protein [Clostridia bacterium]